MQTNSSKIYLHCSLFLLTFLFLFSILNFTSLYPHFSDVYYHMSVVRSFSDAKGLVLTDYWSFAPSGRPHIYMPFIHTLGYLLNTVLGIIPWAYITALSWLMVPLSFLLTWLLVRDCESDSAALIALSFLAGSGAWFFNQAAHTANAVALCLGLGALLSYKRDRFILTFVLCLFACLSHGTGFTAVIAIIAVSICCPYRLLRRALPIGVAVAAGAAPWVYHVAKHSKAIQPMSGILQLQRFHIALILVFLCASGFIILTIKGVCYLKKKDVKQAENAFFFPALLLSFVIFFPLHYAHRFWGFNSYLPYACLAGCGGASLILLINRKINNRVPIEVFVIILIFINLTFQPTLNSGLLSAKNIQYQDTSIQRMLHPGPQTSNKRRLAAFLEKNKMYFSPGAIVYSSGAQASLVTAITGARTSGGMLAEVISYKRPASIMESDFVLRVNPHSSHHTSEMSDHPPPAHPLPAAAIRELPVPRGFQTIVQKNGIGLFRNTIKPKPVPFTHPTPAAGFLYLVSGLAGFLILIFSDIFRFCGYRAAAVTGGLLVLPLWTVLCMEVSKEDPSPKPIWRDRPPIHFTGPRITPPVRKQIKSEDLYKNIPGGVKQRIDVLNRMLQKYRSAGINVDKFWPIERQKRLESCLRRQDFNGAKKIIILGLRDSKTAKRPSHSRK